MCFLFQQLKEQPKEESDEKINAAIRQVALADFIILNKTDLVTNEQKDDLVSAIRTVNGASPLLETVKCTVSLDDILDLNAYSGSRKDRLTSIVEEVKRHGNTSHLDKDVGTVTFELEKGITRKCLDLFLQRLLWEKMVSDKKGNPSTVIRFKALCRLTDEAEPVLVQAVYDTYDCQSVDSDEIIGCRFIFIGTHLNKESLHNLLLKCMEDEDC